MHLDSLPLHLIIVGGSYIGLEFGQMFRRFGSEVTIIETGPPLIAGEDEDVSRARNSGHLAARRRPGTPRRNKVQELRQAGRRDYRRRRWARRGC